MARATDEGAKCPALVIWQRDCDFVKDDHRPDTNVSSKGLQDKSRGPVEVGIDMDERNPLGAQLTRESVKLVVVAATSMAESSELPSLLGSILPAR